MLQNSNRSGGEKAGPLVFWGRQFIFSKEVIFEVFGIFEGSGWRNFWRFWVEDFWRFRVEEEVQRFVLKGR